MEVRSQVLRNRLLRKQVRQVSKYYYAILKYGWLNVHHEILRDNLTVEEANNLEKYYIKYYKSNYQAAKILNCDQGHIRRCCQHKEGRKQHKGYIFKYKEELI